MANQPRRRRVVTKMRNNDTTIINFLKSVEIVHVVEEQAIKHFTAKEPKVWRSRVSDPKRFVVRVENEQLDEWKHQTLYKLLKEAKPRTRKNRS